MNVLNRGFLLGLLFVTALAWCVQAMACDCTQPANYGNPACKQIITQALNGASNVNATGGNGGQGGSGGNAASRAVSRSDSSSNSESSARGGNARADASNAGNTQSSVYAVERSAPPVGPGVIAPNGCGAGAQGGGSNTRGAMMAGFAWTTDECYAFILAQSFQAIGDRTSACEILLTTNAAKRAIKRGATFKQCVTTVVTREPVPELPATERMYTRAQVDTIVRKAVAK
jgi:hypothetical protein